MNLSPRSVRPLVPATWAKVLVALACAWVAGPAGIGSRPAIAGHLVEAGTGFQNTGATREIGWEPSVQGSRKDVPAFVGWRLVGNKRFYWAPSVRIQYTNFWSLGGAGNLLGVTLAPCGVGVYLTPPPASYSPGDRNRHWFVTLELNVGSLQIGGNITPNAPQDEHIPDADAHRADLRAELAREGGVSASAQHYPFGSYSYVSLGLPLPFRAWKMVTDRIGVGFFVEVNTLLLEWPLDRPVGHPAYGYNLTAGMNLVHF
jgi:hypothetical protein